MKPRNASRLAWSLWGVSVALVLAAVGFYLWTRAALGGGDEVFIALMTLAAGSFGTMGALIASRSRNVIGWLFLASALFIAFGALANYYAVRGILAAPGTLPGTSFMALVQGMSVILFAAPLPLVFLLFPDGRPGSRFWLGVVIVYSAAATFGLFGYALTPGEVLTFGHLTYRIPAALNVPIAPRVVAAVTLGFGVTAFLTALLAVGRLIFRLRRAVGETRQQVKWLAYVAGVAGLALVVGFMEDILGFPTAVGDVAFYLTVVDVTFGIPIAIGIAILKYRLYDIDVVISKTIVYGSLAGFITVVYVAIVVGVGNLVSARGEPNLALQIAATALVAVAFQPVRVRVQRLANRLVYGERATPYEVLARFSEGVAGSYGAQEALPRMARVAAEGTGASSAAVWLRLGETLRPAAAWPAEGQARMEIPLDDGEVPPLPGADRAYPVQHRGELLGALTVAKRPGDPLRPQEDALLRDLAAQAGLVLRNVRLTTDLRARVDEITRQADELRESRRRVVAAQDGERRRLERNIHDGTQQYLVALAVRLRLAENLAGKDPAKARPVLEQLVGETEGTLESLRELARGLYPPLLEREGVAAALRAQASRSAVPVEVAGEIGRYDTDVEAAVYFACLEALQNVAKYADASRATVRLLEENGELRFSVSDDGRGFDPATVPPGSGLRNMADRLAALGATLEVRSLPGEGTTVTARIQVRQREAAR
jgi:signal transduction histidine kinase